MYGFEIWTCKLKHNLELAIAAYISRVSGCKCGDTTISLYEGDKTDDRQGKRDLLNIFLKGSQVAKDTLQRDHPELFSYFEEIWSVRNRHIVQGLPSQYMFFLRCCFQKDCMHARCQSGPP